MTRDNETARVSIADKGLGIPADRSEHIFNKFTQMDASNSRAKGGTGLGLNISDSIIEGMAVRSASNPNSASAARFSSRYRSNINNWLAGPDPGSVSSPYGSD